MLEERGYSWPRPPLGAPVNVQTLRDDHFSDLDSSVNAVSFGFVATAILIFMFLVMAIFERFLRPTSPALSPSDRRGRGDIESQVGFNEKPGHPSPNMTVYSNEVSVLMPGDEIPTFIAHPAPAPCRPERVSCPFHQLHNTLPCPSTSNAQSDISQV